MWRTTSCTSCGASIIWTVTEKRGKKMPVDAEPIAGGMFRLIGQGERNAPLAATILPGVHVEDDERHTSHFATCPHADQHRKGRVPA